MDENIYQFQPLLKLAGDNINCRPKQLEGFTLPVLYFQINKYYHIVYLVIENVITL